MTVTESENGSGNGKVPATRPGDGGDAAQLARAREGIVADLIAVLPDTESLRRLGITVQDFAADVWTGSIWDIQPPSPRELVDRALSGRWNTSGERPLRFLAKTGMVLTLAWSVPLYTLAVLSQRFGRAFWAVVVAVLIWNLI